MDFPTALEILRQHAGTKYDPIVVDALQSALAKGRLAKFEARAESSEGALPSDAVSLPIG
jgi:HD-GYP domain-containing protein (c-di-GMP phosphodiesterase class II)